MEPLDVLFEGERPRAADLPSELARLYGGGVGFEEPCLYSNFVSTIDGIVALPSVPQSNVLIADSSEGDRFVMGLLRAVRGRWPPRRRAPGSRRRSTRPRARRSPSSAAVSGGASGPRSRS